MTTIILVRHGQTDWNREERFRGRYDIELNENGIQQAHAAAKRIAEQWQPVVAATSPLERTKRTAAIIGDHLEVPLRVETGLIDIDYGEWQGLTRAEAHQQWPGLIDDWFVDPTHVRCPTGESLRQVRRRAMQAVKCICLQNPDTAVVMVSHLVVIRLILLSMLGMPSSRFWDIEQEPCAINLIEYHQNRFRLVRLNDTCHLK